MTIDATAALGTYAYQSTLATTSRANAVFQVLAQAYSNSQSTSSDPLSALVSQANNAPLVSAIYTQGKALQASGTADGTTQATGLLGLDTAQLVSGLSSASSSSSLSELFGDATSGFLGFDAATASGSTLALLAAQARKAYGSGTLTADAKAQAAAGASEADAASGAGTSTSQPYLLQASAAAQLAAMNNTFTLLA
ncbi:hypothetical protein [Mesoterricola silvestris]|uniref:Uncharacterized protein n=1 Tax=Mesoterricola silvestris TaxID=2927979 RepID=A0AA48GLS3_9BACT|nr:hypothetical protein [Mesoterricola silvestris]BDU71815.1 hypothetical protein METEAL_09890 [Mesoterricola silvestris]